MGFDHENLCTMTGPCLRPLMVGMGNIADAGKITRGML